MQRGGVLSLLELIPIIATDATLGYWLGHFMDSSTCWTTWQGPALCRGCIMTLQPGEMKHDAVSTTGFTMFLFLGPCRIFKRTSQCGSNPSPHFAVFVNFIELKMNTAKDKT
jgi:hypothetical protein